MEESRTNPQGVFSYVKSRFISKLERRPLYVPNIEVRFFETCFDHFTKINGRLCGEIPSCTSPFPQHTTRCIWCNIIGRCGQWQPSRRYMLSYYLYGPDGTLLDHRTESNVEISLSDWKSSHFVWRRFKYGWREPGNWPIGEYQAEVLIDGASVATGHFAISPPPPPKPAKEVLLEPRVRFYGSRDEAGRRDNVRFPHQTTHELFCSLRVRNLRQQNWNYELTVQCHTNAGELLCEKQQPWYITSQQQEPSIFWHYQTSGWSQGIYHVDVLIDGKEFAWGMFTIE
jgi:hypothetical protein